MEDFFQIDWSFIDRVGDNPFLAMWFFLANGGWIILLITMVWIAVKGWQHRNQNVFDRKRTFVVLSISVPRTHEQGPRAVENMFAYLAGAHSPPTWYENWFVGKTQDVISCEIVSTEGHVQFIIRTTRAFRDLVEAAIYSQYPDADIVEIEDYTKKLPHHFPDEEYDLWGIEMVPAGKSDVYPLKTYPYFEDKITMEFKDPMSALIESFGRAGPDEHIWYQIILKPIDQKEFQKKGETLLKKLLGIKAPVHKSVIDHALDLPLKAGGMLLEGVLGGGGADVHAKPAEKVEAKIKNMTQGEKDVISAMENKLSKINYLCKMRFVYVAKKTAMNKAKVANPFVGSIKQFNTNHMLSLKPETKHVGVNGALWWFKDSRNNTRKNHLVHAYARRSGWAGAPAFHLCTEELATLWHFPHSIQVKAPQLQKTESKRSEPPRNLPFA